MRRHLVLLTALVLLISGLLGFGRAMPEAAANSCGSGGTFTTPNKCAYASTRAADSFTVPAGVTSIHVVVVGGHGANGGSNTCGSFCGAPGGSGGSGDNVTADLPVTPGGTLTVTVGANGNGRTGGFRDGGTGGAR